MARTDPVSDETVLKHAKQLMGSGIYPTGLAVKRALNHRWTESPIADALARLRASGRLVVTLPKPVRRGPLEPEPEYDAGEVADLVREVRHDMPPPRAEGKTETITEWLRRLYWTPQRRALYRRASC